MSTATPTAEHAPGPEAVPDSQALVPPAPWWQPLGLAERGYLPDALIRFGIRRKLARKLRAEAQQGAEDSLDGFVAQLDAAPLALATDQANAQHYEVPTAYFRHALGPRLKYSSAYWPAGVTTLERAEEAMLRLTVERAGIAPGQRVLELGCGWGSFLLYAAEQQPDSRFTGLSNSRTQRAYILESARERGLDNVEVITADINAFDTQERYDRIVSIEMFEHLRNYREILRRTASWLEPQGQLFVHIFTHRRIAYPFTAGSAGADWMAQLFFTGGTMPSDDLLLRFQDDLALQAHWRLNGRHYQKTLEAWLERHDQAREPVLKLFAETYGDSHQAQLWYERWRLFYLACSELFGYRKGREWQVSHYRFSKR